MEERLNVQKHIAVEFEQYLLSDGCSFLILISLITTIESSTLKKVIENK